jgi:DNA-binding MarR family transcriptional regulator
MTNESEPPESELPLALRAAYLTLHRRSDARFARCGVTADQFVLLATLARGGTLTQRELARRMPSDPSTVRAMLVLLEGRGLVRRDRHPDDSRARTAVLTPAGRRKVRQVWKAGGSIRSRMTESLRPDEVETLVGLLRKVTASFDVECASVG